MTAAMTGGEWSAWAMLAGGMFLSHVYSGVETGMYVVNKIRLDLRAEAGQRRARALRAALRDPRELLGVILVGNNLANYLASAGMVLLLTLRDWEHPGWYALAILTPLLFVFCELLPKSLFYRHGETLTYALAGLMTLSRRAFACTGLLVAVRGLVWLITALARRPLGPYDNPLGARGRIASILAEGQASGALTHAQSVIADHVVNLARLRMRDVMVPLGRAVLAEEQVTPEGLRQLLRAHGHARVGLYSGRRDNIVGMLNLHDVLLDADGAPPATHATPPLTVAEGAGVIEALVQLQRRGETMAFVLSSDGRCVGLATIKDLVEEIVGELEEW